MDTQNISDLDYFYNEFPEEPSEFTIALEEALCKESTVLDYPETEHPKVDDIIF